MKKLITPSLALTLLISGCASQIMQGYVGQTVADVMGDYGMPATAFDMPDGTRAFLWQMGQSSSYGGNSYTTGSYIGNTSAYGYGNTAYANTTGNMFATTYTSPVFTTTSTCGYMLYAKKVADLDSPAAWKIVSFKKPRLDCE